MRAVGGEPIFPVDLVGVGTVTLDQFGDAILAGTATLLARDAQHVELAFKVAEREGSTAGHA